MNDLNWFIDLWLIFTTVVTIASIIAKYTPSQWDDELLARIKTVLDFVAINPKVRK